MSDSSGFYGVVRPLDGVVPYRLEMQAKGAPGDIRNLYTFWSDKLYNEVMDESRVLINLASKEYSKCIERYLKPISLCHLVFSESLRMIESFRRVSTQRWPGRDGPLHG